jgi:ribosomal protein L4
LNLVEEFGKEKTQDCNSLFHNLVLNMKSQRKKTCNTKITKKLKLPSRNEKEVCSFFKKQKKIIKP